MFEYFINIIAPHNCLGCATEGKLLCQPCQTQLLVQKSAICFLCLEPSTRPGLCQTCSRLSQTDALWAVQVFEGSLKKLIYAYKFERARAANGILVNLLDHHLPGKITTDIVVAIPTVPAHQRARGYDHAKLLAKGLAKRRGWQYENILNRASATRQRGATRSQRFKQAKTMFEPLKADVKGKTVLIIDDVLTTGATMQAAAKALKIAGAAKVYGAVCAFEPLK